MVYIPAGEVVLGDARGYPEERNQLKVEIGAFYMDTHEVTNAQFAKFVQATNYQTLAERALDPKDFPDIELSKLVPGSAVFQMPKANETVHAMSWWRFIEGAYWRNPEGNGNESLNPQSPVVHIAYEDALAYAQWKGHDLPTEAEWEHAARGGSTQIYAWGDQFLIDGDYMANSWQGAFPNQDLGEDGFIGRAPIGCFPPNRFGLYDMIGNVWEWTKEVYSPNRQYLSSNSATNKPYVIKGGSFLCAPNYCIRYRPAARQPQETGLGTNHLGFRTVKRILQSDIPKQPL